MLRRAVEVGRWYATGGFRVVADWLKDGQKDRVVRVPVSERGAPLPDTGLVLMDGSTPRLSDYRGKPVLVINTASQCGLTPQFDALQALWTKFEGSGLVMLGFPSNDFSQQDPGSNDEIANFCRVNYGVTFPMHEKIVARGAGQSPLFDALTHGGPPVTRGDIKWNFTKFLLDKQGRVAARFDPAVTPDDPRLVAAVTEVLAE